MACLEVCECGRDKNCPDCGGRGAYVVDTMVWGAKRGYNAYPESRDTRKKSESIVKKIAGSIWFRKTC